MQPYRYKIFNLNVSSSIACPELIPGNHAQPDVTIRLGRVPKKLTNVVRSEIDYQASPEEFLLDIEEVAKYFITDGTKILIERYPEGDDDSIILYLLGSAMGALLHQRGMLPLHGSAIEFNGKSIVFTGPSGIGKSTIAGTFHKHNYCILADDVCVLAFNHEGSPVVLPGYPYLKLWSDSAQILGQDVSRLRKVLPDMNKHKVPLLNSFCQTPVPLSRVYLLDSSENGKPSIETIQGAAKLSVLLENTYRSNFLLGIGGLQSHFQKCAEVANRIVIKKVIRSDCNFILEELIERLESDFIN
jgi:hypothetical protein